MFLLIYSFLNRSTFSLCHDQVALENNLPIITINEIKPLASILRALDLPQKKSLVSTDNPFSFTHQAEKGEKYADFFGTETACAKSGCGYICKTGPTCRIAGWRAVNACSLSKCRWCEQGWVCL